jgi:hypothetical protein
MRRRVVPEDVTLGEFTAAGEDGVARPAWTYRHVPGGRPCDACTDRVERLWRAGERSLCAACTEWNRLDADGRSV